jgi:hypothetical protein
VRPRRVARNDPWDRGSPGNSDGSTRRRQPSRGNRPCQIGSHARAGSASGPTGHDRAPLSRRTWGISSDARTITRKERGIVTFVSAVGWHTAPSPRFCRATCLDNKRDRDISDGAQQIDAGRAFVINQDFTTFEGLDSTMHSVLLPAKSAKESPRTSTNRESFGFPGATS